MSGKFTALLRTRGFTPFLVTQFLGALNDNIFKIAISLMAVSAAAGSGGSGALTLIGAVFIIPFILFSGYAGNLADRYSKRNVLVAMKAMEILIMGIGIWAFASGRMEFLLGVLFLMAVQSAFFGPSKFGIIPEMLPDRELSRANGLVEMSTFLAIILGTSLGGVAVAGLTQQPWIIGCVLLVIAGLGFTSSLGIKRVPAASKDKPFGINPWGEIAKGFSRLYGEKPLWLTVIGISYFWFLGAMFQMNLILLGKETMGLNDVWVGFLGAFLAIGIGAGSLAAGRLSGDKVELGLVPLGSIGIGVFAIALSRSTGSLPLTCVVLIFLGFFAGLFIVPLNSFLQQKSGKREKGRLIATNNFMNTVGILLASGTLWVLRDELLQAPERIMLYLGILTFFATVYILTVLPDFLIRFSLWILTHTLFRIKIVGQANVPSQGPALLICNHVSHIDPFLVGASLQRFIRFMAHRDFTDMKGISWLFRLMKAIPVRPGKKSEVIRALELSREELRKGHVVCIFSEGGISRTGNMLPLKKGFERIMEGMDVPIIPMHLDRLWGSCFTFRNGRFFWKFPDRVPNPVTVSFGRPLPASAKAAEVRQAIMELGTEAVVHRRTPDELLHLQFIRTAKKRWSRLAMADSMGKELSFGRALAGAMVLGKWIRKNCPGEEKIGLLLPSSIGGALGNIAVLLAGKVPVNLNFTSGRESIEGAIEQCEIRTILSSKIFLKKIGLELEPEIKFLEDVMKNIPKSSGIMAFLAARLLPTGFLLSLYRDKNRSPDSLATVIYSSGSTGAPKGIMLSHHNIISNVESIAQVFWLDDRDRMMGVLPFFHSFGYTGTIWLPLISGFPAVYHPNPMDAKEIGRLVLKYRATLLISTPTFVSAYIRKCGKEELTSLRYAVVGAEKLQDTVAESFYEKFGIDLLEGYGCTEMGPVVAVNVPDVRDKKVFQKGRKFGTVGHPVPGVSVRVVDPETGEERSVGEEGLLLVKGPSLMMGYLKQPEKTRKSLRGGWYVTGDIGALDEDGFLRITDRLSRFSKIGGEMVPHIKIEEALNRISEGYICAVTAVPDKQKGEKIVVFYTDETVKPSKMCEGLSAAGLPKLWIPKRENFHHLSEIPLLGTGKTDLGGLKKLALEKEKSA